MRITRWQRQYRTGLAEIPDPIPTDLSIREVLDRDRWQCTASRWSRIDKDLYRCSIAGSEMIAVHGITLCPRCAGVLAQQMREEG